MAQQQSDYTLDLSIVIPLYNEEKSLAPLYNRIAKTMQAEGFAYEVIFVDDGSTDNSWQVIENLVKSPNIHALRFARNYGKSAALQCGFVRAKGRIVATMDADLQDAPEELPAMMHMLEVDNLHLVSGWKQKRYDPRLTKNLPSKLFNATARKVSGIHNLHDFNCGLKVYRNEVVKNIELYNDMHRFIPFLAKNEGYNRIGEKVVKHAKRQFGTSKYGISRFFNGFLDLITLWFTSRYGRKPMHFFGTIGTLIFILGFIALGIVLVTKLVALTKGVPAPLVTNRVYIFLALTAMIIGVQLFTAGFLGELLAKQNQHRNDYNILQEL